MSKYKVRKCRVCGLEFRTYLDGQKTCGRAKCKRLWKRIYGKIWREAHPAYHRNYMRKYRRIGLEVSALTKGNLAWLTDNYHEAQEQYQIALAIFKQDKNLNMHQQVDMNLCISRLKVLKELIEVL